MALFSIPPKAATTDDTNDDPSNNTSTSTSSPIVVPKKKPSSTNNNNINSLSLGSHHRRLDSEVDTYNIFKEVGAASNHASNNIDNNNNNSNNNNNIKNAENEGDDATDKSTSFSDDSDSDDSDDDSSSYYALSDNTDNTSEDNGSVSKSVVDMEQYLGMVNGLHNHDHDDEYLHSMGSNDDGNDSLTHFDCNALDQTTAAITTHSILSHHPNVHDDINGVAAASQQHRHADDDDELHDNHYLETTPYVTLEPPSFMPLPTTIQLCHSNDVANDDASGNSGSKSANSFVGTVGKSVMGIIHGSSTTKSKTQFAGDKHDNTIHRNTKNITSKTTSTAKSTAPKKELSLSISSVEGPTPSLEIVPTMDIPTVMPLWKENWTKERKEWEEREEKIRQERLLLVLNRQIDLKRSQTHGNTITTTSSSSRSGGGSGKGSGGGGGGICGLGSIIKVRRNHSEPVVSHLKSCNGQPPPPPPSFHNAHSNHLHSQHGKHPHNNDRNNNHHHHHHRTKSITGSRGTTRSNENSKTRKYKYGMPPTIPSKFQKQPNPIVTTSSKKIGKKHARYALTAGMMLGIRESVGGALGVEHELEIGRWRELELELGGDDGEGVDENGNVVVVVDDDGDGGGENVEGVVEKNEHDDNVEDSNNAAGVDGSTKGNASQNSSQSTSTAKATPKRTSTAQTTSSQSPKQYNTSNTSSTTTTTGTSTSNTNKSKTTSAYTTMLTQECARVSKYKFPPHQFYLGSNTRAGPLPHKYKFKVYAPLVFARIRSLFGVEKQTFLHSICGKFNFYEFASNARSGQFFFYSHDGRYMIKTLTPTESKFLREILPFYYRHLTRFPHTFLTHFYGMYRVCMPNANNQRLHFIIMRSVFHTEKKIDRVFDLKGSRLNRKASAGDKVGKDLDILEEGRKLRFVDPKAKGAFLEQLRRDATFLARLGIMDYSLLLGLHQDRDGGGEEEDGVSSDVISTSGNNVDGATSSPIRSSDTRKKDTMNDEEPKRSNTPFRRCVLRRAASTDSTKQATNDDGFQALEDLNRVMEKKLTKSTSAVGGKGGKDVVCNESIPQDRKMPAAAASQYDSAQTTKATSISSASPSRAKRQARAELVSPNPITSRSDLGIEGYGVKLEDGSLRKKEIYFCGIIDILQYYNARKMGETVIKKAAGNPFLDISCVDPESYGNRFVKFISKLTED